MNVGGSLMCVGIQAMRRNELKDVRPLPNYGYDSEILSSIEVFG
jgi:hypothetical protein